MVAVPWALLTWGHWPISGVPSVDQLRDLPSTVASDTAIIGAFTVALWVAWAVFVVCLVAEVVAEARGREASRVAALGPVQRLARHLVATVAMTVGWLGPLAGSSLPPPARPAAATVPSSPASPQPANAGRGPGDGGVHRGTPQVRPGGVVGVVGRRRSSLAQTPEAPAPAPAVTVVVRAGDSPWALAQEHLGDGARWTEIWDLNRGAPQPDGRTWQSPETIMPGWQFTLPAGSAATAAGALMGADQIMVQPDDNPWTLAETHLGDGKRWRELFDANRGRIQSDGDAWLTESLVRPGWILNLPSATTLPAPLPPVAAPTAPAPPATQPAPAPPVAQPAPTPAPAVSRPAPDSGPVRHRAGPCPGRAGPVRPAPDSAPSAAESAPAPAPDSAPPATEPAPAPAAPAPLRPAPDSAPSAAESAPAPAPDSAPSAAESAPAPAPDSAPAPAAPAPLRPAP